MLKYSKARQIRSSILPTGKQLLDDPEGLRLGGFGLVPGKLALELREPGRERLDRLLELVRMVDQGLDRLGVRVVLVLHHGVGGEARALFGRAPRPVPMHSTGSSLWIVAGSREDSVVTASPGSVRRHPCLPDTVVPLPPGSWFWVSPVSHPLQCVPFDVPHDARPLGRGSDSSGIAAAQTVPGLLPGAADIAAHAACELDAFISYPVRTRSALFDPWRESEDEDDDRYQVLPLERMSRSLQQRVARALSHIAPLPHSLYFQINRYRSGDFVLPHRDDFPQGLYMLTGSPHDGLVAQSSTGFERLLDSTGTGVFVDPRAWHWVDPVADSPRYSLVTIPPIRPAGLQ